MHIKGIKTVRCCDKKMRVKSISIVPTHSSECKSTLTEFWKQYNEWEQVTEEKRPSVPKFIKYLLKNKER